MVLTASKGRRRTGQSCRAQGGAVSSLLSLGTGTPASGSGARDNPSSPTPSTGLGHQLRPGMELSIGVSKSRAVLCPGALTGGGQEPHTELCSRLGSALYGNLVIPSW